MEKKKCENCPTEMAEDRRSFLTKLTFILGGIGTLLIGIPVLGALFEPLIKKEKKPWRKVGKITEFKVGDTVLVKFPDGDILPWGKEISYTASWLRRVDEENFEAYTINCAHLGCPVRWIAESELFLCPCHGGVYYKNGDVAAGPPPRPLQKYPVRTTNGYVEIRSEEIPITTIENS